MYDEETVDLFRLALEDRRTPPPEQLPGAGKILSLGKLMNAW